MTCCGGNCGCAAGCKCGNGCGGCNKHPDFSISGEKATTETVIVGVATERANIEGPSEMKAGEKNEGCSCNPCKCNPCNC